MKTSKTEKQFWAIILVWFALTMLLFGCVPAHAQGYSQKKEVIKQFELDQSTDELVEQPITIVQVNDYVLDHQVSIIFKDTRKNIIHADYEQETDALGGISFLFYVNNNQYNIQITSTEIVYICPGHYYKLLVKKIY